MKKLKSDKKIIGWREWLTLGDLKIQKIKAKIDTGARTSSLHAIDLEFYKRNGNEFVKFKVQSDQGKISKVVNCRAKVLEYRKIKSSNGQTEIRPVILTSVEVLGEKWPIEVTLTNRHEMGFRMLLGRASIKGKFLVDTGKSYYCKKLTTKRIKK
jgi:hypothetical protein